MGLETRNNRGFLPDQMCHRKIYDDTVYNDPDYMFVVKTSRCAFFVNQLEELGLQVKTYSGTFNLT